MDQPAQRPSPAHRPLSPDDLRQLAASRARGKKLRRAVGVATFSGWTTAIVAIPTFLGGLFSPEGWVLGAGLGVVAWGEFVGAGLLRRLDPRGPRRLALNQIALALLVSAYALWQIVTIEHGPGLLAAGGSGDPQVDALLEPYEALATDVARGFYGVVILVSLAVQGATAWYYASRTRHLRAYLESSPTWILELEGADA